MKSYFIKMALVILIISSFINIYKEKNEEKSELVIHNIVNNNIIYKSNIPDNIYEEVKVYENMTLTELSTKLDNVLNSDLNGYGEIIASRALDTGVDPVVATSIILLETGCKWSCSSLVKYNNNVGGMRSNKGYMKYSSLDEGINAFINNLANNYYAKGLNTPELINKKYATNPEWYKKVYYYVDLIKAS